MFALQKLARSAVHQKHVSGAYRYKPARFSERDLAPFGAQARLVYHNAHVFETDYFAHMRSFTRFLQTASVSGRSPPLQRSMAIFGSIVQPKHLLPASGAASSSTSIEAIGRSFRFQRSAEAFSSDCCTTRNHHRGLQSSAAASRRGAFRTVCLRRFQSIKPTWLWRARRMRQRNAGNAWRLP